MTSSIGSVGAIYDRTAIVKSSYEDFRRATLVADDRLASLADLGWGVLDANVEVTTSVLSRVHDGMLGVFLDVRNAEPEQKGVELFNTLRASQLGEGGIRGIAIRGSDFQQFPNAVVGYDFPEFLRRAFEDSLSLSSSGCVAFTGHQFKTEQHFRLWWETSALTPPPFIARLFNGAGFVLGTFTRCAYFSGRSRPTAEELFNQPPQQAAASEIRDLFWETRGILLRARSSERPLFQPGGFSNSRT